MLPLNIGGIEIPAKISLIYDIFARYPLFFPIFHYICGLKT